MSNGSEHTRLSRLSAGRDNNLNLLRVVAAAAVLFSHSYSLSSGIPDAEPLVSLIGMPPGSIAVDVFFVVSGFLVTGSILRTRSVADFAAARILRILPGLLVMLMLTTFGMGLVLTNLPWRDYLQSHQTHSYVARCATLFAGIAYELPGVFESNPHRKAVNGSLWTLPYEVKMYALLALGWLACAACGRLREKAFAALCVAAMAFAGLALLVSQALKGEAGRFVWLFFMFFSGASCFILRERIRFTTKAALLVGVALLTAALASKAAFVPVYLVGLWYLIFYVAYVPGGFIRKYNQAGDFSYGMYIYAFPVQQAVVALTPGISPLTLLFWSGSFTLLLAMLSWFGVEKPALGLKGRLVPRLTVGLRYGPHSGFCLGSTLARVGRILAGPRPAGPIAADSKNGAPGPGGRALQGNDRVKHCALRPTSE